MIAETHLQGSIGDLGNYLSYGQSGRNRVEDRSERVGWETGRNVGGTGEMRRAEEKMKRTAARAGRGTKKPVYQIIVSWQSGNPEKGIPPDDPSREEMEETADRVRERLGLEDHEAWMVGHKDTETPHVHIMVNRIHPKTGKAWNPSWEKTKIYETLREIEQEKGWDRPGSLPMTIEEKYRQEEPGALQYWEAQSEELGREPSVRKWAREGDLGKALTGARSWEEVTAATEKAGASLETRGSEGMVLEREGKRTALSSIDPSISRPRLEARFRETWADYQRRMAAQEATQEGERPAPRKREQKPSRWGASPWGEAGGEGASEVAETLLQNAHTPIKSHRLMNARMAPENEGPRTEKRPVLEETGRPLPSDGILELASIGSDRQWHAISRSRGPLPPHLSTDAIDAVMPSEREELSARQLNELRKKVEGLNKIERSRQDGDDQEAVEDRVETRYGSYQELKRSVGEEVNGLSRSDKARLATQLNQDGRNTANEAATFERNERLYEEAAQFYEKKLEDLSERSPKKEYIDRKTHGQAESANVGFAPNKWHSLENHLKEKGYDEEELIESGLVRERKDGEGVYDTFKNQLVVFSRNNEGKIRKMSGRWNEGTRNPEMNRPEAPKSTLRNVPAHEPSEAAFGVEGARAQGKDVVVTEGFSDALAARSEGESAVALTGRSISEEQAQLIEEAAGGDGRVTVMLDGDSAGRVGSIEVVQRMEERGIHADVVRPPGELDVDEMVQRGEDISSYIDDNRIDGLRYVYENSVQEEGTTTESLPPEERAERFDRAMDVATSAPTQEGREGNFDRLMEISGVGEYNLVRESFMQKLEEKGLRQPSLSREEEATQDRETKQAEEAGHHRTPAARGEESAGRDRGPSRGGDDVLEEVEGIPADPEDLYDELFESPALDAEAEAAETAAEKPAAKETVSEAEEGETVVIPPALRGENEEVAEMREAYVEIEQDLRKSRSQEEARESLIGEAGARVTELYADHIESPESRLAGPGEKRKGIGYYRGTGTGTLNEEGREEVNEKILGPNGLEDQLDQSLEENVDARVYRGRVTDDGRVERGAGEDVYILEARRGSSEEYDAYALPYARIQERSGEEAEEGEVVLEVSASVFEEAEEGDEQNRTEEQGGGEEERNQVRIGQGEDVDEYLENQVDIDERVQEAFRKDEEGLAIGREEAEAVLGLEQDRAGEILTNEIGRTENPTFFEGGNEVQSYLINPPKDVDEVDLALREGYKEGEEPMETRRFRAVAKVNYTVIKDSSVTDGGVEEVQRVGSEYQTARSRDEDDEVVPLEYITGEGGGGGMNAKPGDSIEEVSVQFRPGKYINRYEDVPEYVGAYRVKEPDHVDRVKGSSATRGRKQDRDQEAPIEGLADTFKDVYETNREALEAAETVEEEGSAAEAIESLSGEEAPREVNRAKEVIETRRLEGDDVDDVSLVRASAKSDELDVLEEVADYNAKDRLSEQEQARERTEEQPKAEIGVGVVYQSEYVPEAKGKEIDSPLKYAARKNESVVKEATVVNEGVSRRDDGDQPSLRASTRRGAPSQSPSGFEGRPQLQEYASPPEGQHHGEGVGPVDLSEENVSEANVVASVAGRDESTEDAAEQAEVDREGTRIENVEIERRARVKTIGMLPRRGQRSLSRRTENGEEIESVDLKKEAGEYVRPEAKDASVEGEKEETVGSDELRDLLPAQLEQTSSQGYEVTQKGTVALGEGADQRIDARADLEEQLRQDQEGLQFRAEALREVRELPVPEEAQAEVTLPTQDDQEKKSSERDSAERDSANREGAERDSAEREQASDLRQSQKTEKAFGEEEATTRSEEVQWKKVEESLRERERTIADLEAGFRDEEKSRERLEATEERLSEQIAGTETSDLVDRHNSLLDEAESLSEQHSELVDRERRALEDVERATERAQNLLENRDQPDNVEGEERGEGQREEEIQKAFSARQRAVGEREEALERREEVEEKLKDTRTAARGYRRELGREMDLQSPETPQTKVQEAVLADQRRRVEERQRSAEASEQAAEAAKEGEAVAKQWAETAPEKAEKVQADVEARKERLQAASTLEREAVEEQEEELEELVRDLETEAIGQEEKGIDQPIGSEGLEEGRSETREGSGAAARRPAGEEGAEEPVQSSVPESAEEVRQGMYVGDESSEPALEPEQAAGAGRGESFEQDLRDYNRLRKEVSDDFDPGEEHTYQELSKAELEVREAHRSFEKNHGVDAEEALEDQREETAVAAEEDREAQESARRNEDAAKEEASALDGSPEENRAQSVGPDTTDEQYDRATAWQKGVADAEEELLQEGEGDRAFGEEVEDVDERVEELRNRDEEITRDLNEIEEKEEAGENSQAIESVKRDLTRRQAKVRRKLEIIDEAREDSTRSGANQNQEGSLEEGQETSQRENLEGEDELEEARGDRVGSGTSEEESTPTDKEVSERELDRIVEKIREGDDLSKEEEKIRYENEEKTSDRLKAQEVEEEDIGISSYLRRRTEAGPRESDALDQAIELDKLRSHKEGLNERLESTQRDALAANQRGADANEKIERGVEDLAEATEEEDAVRAAEAYTRIQDGVEERKDAEEERNWTDSSRSQILDEVRQTNQIISLREGDVSDRAVMEGRKQTRRELQVERAKADYLQDAAETDIRTAEVLDNYQEAIEEGRIEGTPTELKGSGSLAWEAETMRQQARRRKESANESREAAEAVDQRLERFDEAAEERGLTTEDWTLSSTREKEAEKGQAEQNKPVEENRKNESAQARPAKANNRSQGSPSGDGEGALVKRLDELEEELERLEDRKDRVIEDVKGLSGRVGDLGEELAKGDELTDEQFSRRKRELESVQEKMQTRQEELDAISERVQEINDEVEKVLEDRQEPSQKDKGQEQEETETKSEPEQTDRSKAEDATSRVQKLKSTRNRLEGVQREIRDEAKSQADYLKDVNEELTRRTERMKTMVEGGASTGYIESIDQELSRRRKVREEVEEKLAKNQTANQKKETQIGTIEEQLNEAGEATEEIREARKDRKAKQADTTALFASVEKQRGEQARTYADVLETMQEQVKAGDREAPTEIDLEKKIQQYRTIQEDAKAAEENFRDQESISREKARAAAETQEEGTQTPLDGKTAVETMMREGLQETGQKEAIAHDRFEQAFENGEEARKQFAKKAYVEGRTDKSRSFTKVSEELVEAPEVFGTPTEGRDAIVEAAEAEREAAAAQRRFENTYGRSPSEMYDLLGEADEAPRVKVNEAAPSIREKAAAELQRGAEAEAEAKEETFLKAAEEKFGDEEAVRESFRENKMMYDAEVARNVLMRPSAYRGEDRAFVDPGEPVQEDSPTQTLEETDRAIRERQRRAEEFKQIRETAYKQQGRQKVHPESQPKETTTWDKMILPEEDQQKETESRVEQTKVTLNAKVLSQRGQDQINNVIELAEKARRQEQADSLRSEVKTSVAVARQGKAYSETGDLQQVFRQAYETKEGAQQATREVKTSEPAEAIRNLSGSNAPDAVNRAAQVVETRRQENQSTNEAALLKAGVEEDSDILRATARAKISEKIATEGNDVNNETPVTDRVGEVYKEAQKVEMTSPIEGGYDRQIHTQIRQMDEETKRQLEERAERDPRAAGALARFREQEITQRQQQDPGRGQKESPGQDKDSTSSQTRSTSDQKPSSSEKERQRTPSRGRGR